MIETPERPEVVEPEPDMSPLVYSWWRGPRGRVPSSLTRVPGEVVVETYHCKGR